jgi:hypothetical protein
MGQGEKRNSEFDIRAYIIYNVRKIINTEVLILHVFINLLFMPFLLN